MFIESIKFSLVIATAIYTFFPAMASKQIIILSALPNCLNYVLIRFFLFFILCFFVLLLKTINYRCFMKRKEINGIGYRIIVEYGDILEPIDGQRVIPFDECFTVKVGRDPEDIKEETLCGQYLKKYPISNSEMKQLIENDNIRPQKKNSLFSKQICYESGTIVTRDNDLLLSFARLDEKGKAKITREEYIKFLFKMWQEIHKYDKGSDIFIPIFGSGITKFNEGENSSSEELLKLIVYSYVLSSNKVKLPHNLHIVCKKNNFDLGKLKNFFSGFVN